MEERTAASLKQTVRAAASGDDRAWAVLVRTCTPRVFALLLRRCGNRDLAEELTQATFVKLVEHLDRYEEQGQFEAWLFRIAMNTLRDEMRRRSRQATATGRAGDRETGQGRPGDHTASAWEGEPMDPQPQALEQLARREEHQQVRAAVARLPDADQEVLHLRFTAGLSFAQIAEALGQPLGTVLARGHRAVNKLKVAMVADESLKNQ